MLAVFLRHIRAVPLTPDLAEVLTNAIALGWAWAFLWPATFGPPGTTVHHITAAFGATPAAAWTATTAVLPLASIAWGGFIVRLASTLLCGFTWSVIAVVSVRGGVWLSPALATAAACLIALFVSQCGIIARWLPGERIRVG